MRKLQDITIDRALLIYLLQLAEPLLNATAAKAAAVVATVSRLNGRFGLAAGGSVKDSE